MFSVHFITNTAIFKSVVFHKLVELSFIKAVSLVGQDNSMDKTARIHKLWYVKDNDNILNRGFSKLNKIGNNANIGIRGFTT